MNNTNLDEQKKLSDEAHEHSHKMLEISADAEKLHREALRAETPHEQHEALKLVHSADREAISEVHKVTEIQSDLMDKQRADIAKTMQDLREMPPTILLTDKK